jgi:aryl-alcohol dehydrogenase-like predicted oxidoreductase
MNHRRLGASGLHVSTLCLGTMTFGEADAQSFMHGVGCDEATSHAIMNRSLEAGVSFWDTADVYGQDGLSERIIGSWFATTRRRAEVVLATKFRFRMGQGPNGTGASRRRIREACEASLRRLQTDHIDLYQVHMQDLDTPEEETLDALDDLVRAGKVLYIGASNYAAYRLTDAMWTSRTRNRARFVSMQMQYSLLRREIEREHVPLANTHGLGILPWSPLAAGFLTGKFRRDEVPPTGSRLAKWEDSRKGFDNDRAWRIRDAIVHIGEALSTTPAAVSLAWLLQRPAVTSVIFGARNLEQLDANLAAAALVLPAEHVAALDEASSFDPGYPYDFARRIQGHW